MTDILFANHPNEIERQIIVLLVEDLLAAGLEVAVDDGEEVVLPASRDASAIFAAMSTTDQERLRVYGLPKNGWVWLIYGNGADVIMDYTTNIPETVLTRAEALAERFR